MAREKSIKTQVLNILQTAVQNSEDKQVHIMFETDGLTEIDVMITDKKLGIMVTYTYWPDMPKLTAKGKCFLRKMSFMLMKDEDTKTELVTGHGKTKHVCTFLNSKNIKAAATEIAECLEFALNS